MNTCWWNEYLLMKWIDVDEMNGCWWNEWLLMKLMAVDEMNICRWNEWLLMKWVVLYNLAIAGLFLACPKEEQQIGLSQLEFSWVWAYAQKSKYFCWPCCVFINDILFIDSNTETILKQMKDFPCKIKEMKDFPCKIIAN